MRYVVLTLVILTALSAPAYCRTNSESVLERLILEERARRESEATVSESIRNPATGKLDPIRQSESAARFTNALFLKAQAWALPFMVISWFAGFILWMSGVFTGASKNRGPAVMLLGTAGYVLIQAAPILVGVFLRWLENLSFV